MTCRLVVAAILLTGLGALRARAQDVSEEAIATAVQNGIRHLTRVQSVDGSWPTHKVGGTALAGLTLLECGVPATDSSIQKAAAYLRNAWEDISDIHQTYSISLAILFFDRLGDPQDVTIIQALGARLLAGQNAAGAWSYVCPQFSAEDHRRLRTLANQHVELKARNPVVRAVPRFKDDRSWLPKEIRQILGRLETQNLATLTVEQDPSRKQGGDNSNTQFAILGLWAARRHGIPVDKALSRAAARFRSCQHPDGGWGYTTNITAGPTGDGSTTSMTCAGLLALALGHGSAFEASMHTVRSRNGKSPAHDLAKDMAICAGFAALARAVGESPEENRRVGIIAGLGDMYYLLWSVERVAVIYNQKLVGGKDWYAWGAAALLAAQRSDWGWKGRFGTDVDTCFALMFLRRIDLARDLSGYLKGQGMEIALKTNTDAADKGSKAAQDLDLAREDRRQVPARQAETARPDRAPSNTPSADMEGEAKAQRLKTELLHANSAAEDRLLDQLKQSRGPAYTDALAAAIPQLNGTAKTKAREALAERLARMTAATLRDKLKDEAPEVRRAAALACAVKADQQLVPMLIALLEDREMLVARAAHAALKQLTSKDFGPAADASAAERSKAAAAWREWLKGGP